MPGLAKGQVARIMEVMEGGIVFVYPIVMKWGIAPRWVSGLRVWAFRRRNL